MKPYSRVWRLGSLICILALTSLIIHVPLIKPVDATQGNWVIDSESVIIENADLFHEGDIIIRGNGRLSLANSTLTIVQLMSWQFQIYVEDSGMLLINDSDIRSKYPFMIVCNDESEINFTSSSSSNAKFVMSGSNLGGLTGSTFLGIITNEGAHTTIDSCQLLSATSNGDSSMVFANSVIGSIGIKGNSQANISSSNVGPVVVESTKTTNIIDSEASALRCWSDSKIVVSGSTLGDYRYSDYVEASISNSTIGELDATGESPLTLNQIVIGSAILRGSANVSMNECTVGTLEAYLNTAITMWNSTCEDFFSTQYADVKILGTSSAQSYFGNCIITQMCAAVITWSNFDYLEIGHSTTAQVNDSYAYDFENWEYTTCQLDINRCRFTVMRATGSTVTMSNSVVELWANIAIGAEFNAVSCDFLAELTFYDTAKGILENCTMNPLRPLHESNVIMNHCVASIWVIDYRNRVRTIDSIPSGNISYWSSFETGAISSVQWNLTVYDSNIVGWNFLLRYEEDYVISNSTLKKIEVRAQCSVLIEGSFIEELWATNGETKAYQSELIDVGIQTIAHLTLNQCVCDTIWHYDDAVSTHYNSTFNRFYSNGQADCQLFDCVIGSVGPAGNSYIYLENCTMTNFDSFQYATATLVNSTVEDRLATHVPTMTTITNSTIALLAGVYNSQMVVTTSDIGEIRLSHESEAILSNSVLTHISLIGTSQLSIIGNLSGTISCSIQNSAQVIREFQILVEDQIGNPLQSATVEIFDSSENLVATGVSDSLGRCYLSVIFEIAGISFLSEFTVVATFSGYNTTNSIMTTTQQPLLVVINLSGIPAVLTTVDNNTSNSTLKKPILTHHSISIKTTIQFILYAICFASLCHVITPDDISELFPKSRLIKKLATTRVNLRLWLAIQFLHRDVEKEDMKI